ncbi:MAG: hypothetical protein ACT4PY_04880 [Armatimonadota bacterium]
MFLGHYGVAFAAKKAAPKVSFGTLVLSAQFADLLWPILLLLGLEHVRIEPGITAASPFNFTHYPITHSLVGALAWSLLIGLIYFFARRYPRGAWIIGAAVFSHFVLDVIVHRPDLQLVPGLPVRVGLGLWNSIPATLIVEFGFYALGIAICLRATSATDAVGRYALWAMIAVLAVVYLSSLLGPPPPNEQALALFALAAWLFVPWGYWIDRHRTVAAGPGP